MWVMLFLDITNYTLLVMEHLKLFVARIDIPMVSRAISIAISFSSTG